MINKWSRLSRRCIFNDDNINFVVLQCFAVCTPLGFVRLFGVVGQVLVKPHLLRDVDSEFDAFNLEEASVRRKLATTKQAEKSTDEIFAAATMTATTNNNKLYHRVHLQEHKYDTSFLHERLKEIEADKHELGEDLFLKENTLFATAIEFFTTALGTTDDLIDVLFINLVCISCR